MELENAILGFLAWNEMTGYELKALFAKLDFLPWSGNNNQIYTTLMALEKKGLVRKETIQQEKLPAQKRYSATDAGKAQLKLAVLEPGGAPPHTNDFMMHIAWAECLNGTELTGMLDQYQQAVEIELKMAREQLNRGSAIATRDRRAEYLWGMIGTHRLMTLQTELDWLVRLRNGLAGKEA